MVTSEAVKISRKDFVQLCEELKLSTVKDDANWPNARLLMKAKKIPSIFGETEPEVTPEAKVTLDVVLEALKDGATIEFEGEIGGRQKFTKPEKTEAPVVEANGVHEDKPVKEKKVESQPVATGSKTDEYGSRIGAMTAKFNSKIGAEFKTAKEITEEAGIPVNNSGDWNWPHLVKLVEKGLVVKEGNKYRKA